jgi:cadmium resistance protein CadD (predicted permease)
MSVQSDEHFVSTIEAVAIGAGAFVSTNIDDILLLAVFFSERGRRIMSIVLGQFLGIGALVAASVLAALAAVAIPDAWIPLLGLVPCALGVKRLFLADDGDSDEPPRGMSALSVAAVTAANGGDNLGVYIPMFASQPDVVPTYVAVFGIGTGVWCALGYWAVSHRTAGAALARYGHRILPWALIAIGLHVLSGLWW